MRPKRSSSFLSKSNYFFLAIIIFLLSGYVLIYQTDLMSKLDIAWAHNFTASDIIPDKFPLSPTPGALLPSVLAATSDVTWQNVGSNVSVSGDLNTTGKVGVGVVPGKTLHVFGKDNGNELTMKLESTGGFGASKIEFWSDGGGVNNWRPASIKSIDEGNYTGGLAFYTNGTGSGNKTTETEVARIANSRLDVSGNIRPSGGHLIFNSANGVINWGSTGSLYFRTNPTQGSNAPLYTDRVIFSNTGKITAQDYNICYKVSCRGSNGVWADGDQGEFGDTEAAATWSECATGGTAANDQTGAKIKFYKCP